MIREKEKGRSPYTFDATDSTGDKHSTKWNISRPGYVMPLEKKMSSR